MNIIKNIYFDYRRYRATGANNWYSVVLMTQGYWATSTYRIFRGLYISTNNIVLRKMASLIYTILLKGIQIIAGISIPIGCDIGQGLYIGHFGGVILNDDVVIGDNCNLSQGVIIGVAGRAENRGCPKLGNRVYIGANAILIGKIHIGDDVAIGAGAVVTKSIPPKAVVVGNPGKIISFNGSFQYIHYDEMESDIARLKAYNTSVV